MTKEISVGVLGLGAMGVLHAGILNSVPGARLACIVDRDKKLLKVAGKVTRSLNLYPSIEEMLSKETLDAVYVCTPTPSHYEAVKTLFSANKDLALFVEKPLAMNFDQAREIARHSGARAKPVWQGQQERRSRPAGE